MNAAPMPSTAGVRAAGRDQAPGARPGGARFAWLAGLLAAVAPLWIAHELPIVDLPQHAYAVAALVQAGDHTTLYPVYFEPRPGLRPYLGYYAIVLPLSHVMPFELANRLFLTLTIVALPLSLAFLLGALRRPRWPALLAIPFAFGDSFGWGLLGFQAAVPLSFVALGAFVRALADARGRVRWSVVLAVSLVAMFCFHPAPIALIAVGIPWLALLTPVPEDVTGRGPARLRARLPAAIALSPFVLAAIAWTALLTGRSGGGTEMLGRLRSLVRSPGTHLDYHPFADNLRDFPVLAANLLRDGSDAAGALAAVLVALLAAAVALRRRREEPAARPAGDEAARAVGESGRERWRGAGLVVIALALYFLLPYDVRFYVGILNTRFAGVAAALAVTLVPDVGPRAARSFAWLAVVAALLTSAALTRGFLAFDRESRPLRNLVAATGRRPRVMGLLFDRDSRVMRHPVYLHAAAVLARARGGLPDYTLGNWQQAPLRYRIPSPPTYLSEWRPDRFDYDQHAHPWDHFLGRGREPQEVLGAHLGTELSLAARDGGFWLVRRHAKAAASSAAP
jgi:hypothetical protein